MHAVRIKADHIIHKLDMLPHQPLAPFCWARVATMVIFKPKSTIIERANLSYVVWETHSIVFVNVKRCLNLGHRQQMLQRAPRVFRRPYPQAIDVEEHGTFEGL